MSTIIFRTAVLADIPQLARLRLLMQCEVNSIDPSAVSISFAIACEDYFVKSLSDQSYFSAVAELDGQLISANGFGYVHF